MLADPPTVPQVSKAFTAKLYVPGSIFEPVTIEKVQSFGKVVDPDVISERDTPEGNGRGTRGLAVDVQTDVRDWKASIGRAPTAPIDSCYEVKA